MGYERYYDKYDTVSLAFFPEYDSEDPRHREFPVDLELGDKAISVVKRGLERLGEDISVKEGLGRGLASLQWTFQCFESNLPEVVVGIPDNPFGVRINSQILDAPRTEKISEESVKKYLAEYEQSEDRLRHIFPCPNDTSAILFEMEERTGMGSFQLLSTHGAIVWNAVSGFLSAGYVVGAINRETRHAQVFPDYLFPSQHDFDRQVEILAGIVKVVDMPPLEIFPRK